MLCKLGIYIFLAATSFAVQANDATDATEKREKAAATALRQAYTEAAKAMSRAAWDTAALRYMQYQQDQHTHVRELIAAAATDDRRAQGELGNRLLYGNGGMARDVPRAVRWQTLTTGADYTATKLAKLTASTTPDAFLALATYQEAGYGCEQSFTYAQQNFTAARTAPATGAATWSPLACWRAYRLRQQQQLWQPLQQQQINAGLCIPELDIHDHATERLANLLYRNGTGLQNTAEAERLWDTVTKRRHPSIDKTTADGLMMIGLSYLCDSRRTGLHGLPSSRPVVLAAHSYFSRALALDPNNERAKFGLAMTLQRGDVGLPQDLEQARTLLTQLQETYPPAAQALQVEQADHSELNQREDEAFAKAQSLQQAE